MSADGDRRMLTDNLPKTEIGYLQGDPEAAIEKCAPVRVASLWSGKDAPPHRHFSVRLGWTEHALWVRFDGEQAERLVVNDNPDRSRKTMALWDRDVFEIFIAPDSGDVLKYFEFEVAPTGEWIDIALDAGNGERVSDWEYASGMKVIRAEIREASTSALIQIPWSAFGREPKVGAAWRGNLFRCIGSGPSRGYLSWSPTFTPQPNFHVPERFGRFTFVKNEWT